MASSSSGVEFGNPLTVFDVDPPLTQLFEAEHARKRDARANDDPGDVGGSDDDSDDEDNLPPPSTSCQRFAVFCSNRTRLKRVKDLSAGVEPKEKSCCNPHGTSHDVYTIDGSAFMAGLSFGMDPAHPFRRVIFRAINSVFAEQFLFICIFTQTCGLATSIPGNIHAFTQIQTSVEIINHFCLVVYTIEMFMRVIALGLWSTRFAYLRSIWNLLDCLLIVSSILFTIASRYQEGDLFNPSTLRVIRTLRPLRTASFIGAVRAAMGYWRHLLNIGLFMAFSLAVFSVLGVQFFGGALTQVCDDHRLDQATSTTAPVPCVEALFCDAGLCTVDTETYLFGFDNLPEAMLTCFVAAADDFWEVPILKELQSRSLRYHMSIWAFFMILFFLVNVIVANLFCAVVVESYMRHRKMFEDDDDMKNRLKKIIAIFNRLDKSKDGHIETAELRSLSKHLGLENSDIDGPSANGTGTFTEDELLEAMRDMDTNADGQVDFEEFKHYWDGNTNFVIKLKKALQRQEQDIRNVWVRIDQDGSESIDREEMDEMAGILGIKLTEDEILTAMDEMGGTEEIGFDTFVAWWLSDSRVSAKVRQAQKEDDGVAASLFACLLRSDAVYTIDSDDIRDRGKSAFGEVISFNEAGEIFAECLEQRQSLRGNRDESQAVTVQEFDAWWRSTAELAVRFRKTRQVDVARTQNILSDFDVVRGSEAKSDNRLDEQELHKMVGTLKIRVAEPSTSVVKEILAEVDELSTKLLRLNVKQKWLHVITTTARTPRQPSNSADKDKLDQSGVFEVLRLLGCATSSEEVSAIFADSAVGEAAPSRLSNIDLIDYIFLPAKGKQDQPRRRIQRKLGIKHTVSNVPFFMFFTWMHSGSPLADVVSASIDAYGKKKELARTQRFPFIPYVTPFCRSAVLDPTFDQAVLYAIGINTVIMCMHYYEMEKDAPALALFVKGSEMFFSFLFVLECIFKICGIGAAPYFAESSNKFDFAVTASFLVGMFLPTGSGVGALRGLRIIVKLLRVARAAKMLVKNDSVAMLVKTVTESSEVLTILSLFCAFMLLIFALISGHTFGLCHLSQSGDISDEPDVPALNFYSFGDAFHANFLIMQGQSWSAIMFDYAECAGPLYWAYFVLVYGIMNFVLNNLFLAVVTEHFCYSEEEKLVKQEKNHLESQSNISSIMSAAGLAGLDVTDVKAGFTSMKSIGVGKISSATGVLSAMREGTKAKKLAGPLAKIQKDLKRLPAQNHLSKIKEAAERKAIEARQIMAEKAQEAMAAAKEAGEKAASFADAKLSEVTDNLLDGDFEHESAEAAAEARAVAKKGASLHVFTIDSRFRRFAISVVDDPRFEKTVLFFILVSSIVMAVEGPTDAAYLKGDDKIAYRLIIHFLNTLFVAVFWIEAILKIVADGFLKTPNAYLKSGWNRCDFFVVISATADIVLSSFAEARTIRSVRVLRVLRPLRMMKANESLTLLLEAITSALPVLTGAVLLSAIFYLTFAIFGVSLFMGKFHHCSCGGEYGRPPLNCTNDDYSELGKDGCLEQGGQWVNPPYSFDNFAEAMKALFFCATPSSWENIIQSGMDVTIDGEAPQRGHAWSNVVFFWIFIIFDRAFVQNIFTGLLTNFFMQANGAALLTESQGIWVIFNLFVMAQTQIRCFMLSSFVPPIPPEGTFRRSIYDLCTSTWFEPLVNIAIVANVVVLAMETVPRNEKLFEVTDLINSACLYVFTVDVVFRCYAFSPKVYIKENWNKLDLLIVFMAWLSALADELPPGFAVIRALRVFRAMMLVRKSKFLRPLLRTLFLSIPACMNVLGLALLWTFLVAILSMNLYGVWVPHTFCPDSGCITDEDSFDDFLSSMKFLLEVTTGQDFMITIHQLKYHQAAAPFLVIGGYVAIVHVLFLNLFVVILVDMFIRCLLDADVQIDIEHIRQYQTLWRNGKTDHLGEFRGESFTEGPDHKLIDVGKIAEFVPQLLPPTEVLDSSWKPKSLSSLLAGEAPISPLATIVPHRRKYALPALPYNIGQEAHVDGRLCQILECSWSSVQAQKDGLMPNYCKIRFTESEVLDSTRVVDTRGFHVPAVEGFCGLIDSQPCEITWVSAKRDAVRVRWLERLKQEVKRNDKKFALRDYSKSSVMSLHDEDPDSDSDDDTKEQRQKQAHSATMIQATWRGKAARLESKRAEQAKERRKLLDTSVDEQVFDTIGDVKRVQRVVWEGDSSWINRLMLELDVADEEFRSGYRYLSNDTPITDAKGRFLPSVVGLRSLVDGTFVEDVEIGFHELLTALSLIVCSYDGLNFDEMERKRKALALRAATYAARVIQVHARIKFAKRHLVEQVTYETGSTKIMAKWARFHRKFGKYSASDNRVRSSIVVLDLIRKVLLSSMHRCYGIRMASLKA